MKHLHKITISNARRFAKDVEITFGKGATIILAPNGTGKTTVFEAIEFALTGSIQRLVHPPLSLIRDRQSGMDVRLDFDDGKYCEVKYIKDKEPVLKGHHSLLYPNNQKEEVSHLLRLTHLLEQKGTNWFVQQRDSSNAGFILDKLSLGRELQTIFNSKKATLTAATKVVGDAEGEVVSARIDLTEFEELLKYRSQATHNYTLRSLEEIRDDLKEINRLVKGSLKSIAGSKLEAIVGYVSKLESDAESRLKYLSSTLIRLSGFEKKIGTYGKLKIDIAARDEKIRSRKDSISTLDAEIVRVRTLVLTLSNSLNQQQDQLASLVELNNLFSKLDVDRKGISEKENALAQAQINLEALKGKATHASEELSRAKENRSKRAISLENGTRLVTRQSELMKLQRDVEEWQQRESNLKTLETSDLPKAVSARTNAEKILSESKTEFTQLEILFNSDKQNLTSLKNIEDAILGAVTVISTNLDDKESHCPVCDTEFAPEELRRRMDIAMSNVNPLLIEAAEKVKQDEERLSIVTQQVNTATGELTRTNQNLSELQTRIEQIRRSIESYFQKFPGCTQSHEGVTWLGSQVTVVNNEIAKNKKDIETFGQELSNILFNELVVSSQQFAEQVQNEIQRIQSLQDTLAVANRELLELEMRVKGRDVIAIGPTIVQLNVEIKKIQQNLLLNKRSLEQTELKKEELNKDIVQESNLLSEQESQFAKLIAEWRDMDMEGEPTKEKFEAKRSSLQDQNKDCKNGVESLNEIKSELNKWKKAEKFETLDREVKKLVGKLNDQQHLTKLKKTVQDKRNIVADLKEKRSTLNELYSHIGHQINSVHKQLVSINPLWVSLLKKVVLNPRFLDTELSSYAWRNKPHAEIKTKLHNQLVQVMDVASEAQATDLQLTFLLAMATTYSWTPWKALLLDDPTQHHDLVHASGVFDLLRKYILAQDFQVLLGTHDSVQARFFQRKLQNDGIPVNVWNLIADEKGVKAELL